MTYINNFKLSPEIAQFFSAEMIEKMNELDDLLDKYVKYINISEDNNQTDEKIEYKIKKYEKAIRDKQNEIEQNYNIKFTDEPFLKILYPWELI